MSKKTSLSIAIAAISLLLVGCGHNVKAPHTKSTSAQNQSSKSTEPTNSANSKAEEQKQLGFSVDYAIQDHKSDWSQSQIQAMQKTFDDQANAAKQYQQNHGLVSPNHLDQDQQRALAIVTQQYLQAAQRPHLSWTDFVPIYNQLTWGNATQIKLLQMQNHVSADKAKQLVDQAKNNASFANQSFFTNAAVQYAMTHLSQNAIQLAAEYQHQVNL